MALGSGVTLRRCRASRSERKGAGRSHRGHWIRAQRVAGRVRDEPFESVVNRGEPLAVAARAADDGFVVAHRVDRQSLDAHDITVVVEA